MRHFHLARRAGVPTAAALLGVLVAGPALADVTVTPATATQADGANLTFHLTNDGTAPITEVTLSLPADTRLAEMYPLSVDKWAPKIQMETLATPLATIHGGTPATEAAKSITWIAMPGYSLAPGAATDLSVAVGPLPTLSAMQWSLSAKYVGGKPGPALNSPTLKLTPAVAGQGPSGHDHVGTGTTTGGTAADSSDAEDAYFQQALADAQRGPSFWAIGGWVVAGLVLLGGVVMMLRGRHRAEEDDEPEDDEVTPPAAKDTPATEDKEPVAAGSGSKWSFKG